MKLAKYLLVFFLSGLPIFASFAQILYTDFVPDTTISVTTVDSTKLFQIDINHDSLVDYTFGVSHHYQFHSPSCCDYFQSWIAAIDSNSKVAVGDSTYFSCTTVALDSGALIDSNFWWEYFTYLNFEIYGASCLPQPTSPKYYPVKLYINGNYFFGWFRILSTITSNSSTSISLLDMAINMTPNQSIYSGQRVTAVTNSIASKTKIIPYPNPSNGHFELLLPNAINSNEIYTVMIYDNLGRLKLKERALINNNKTTVTLDFAPSGIYHCILSNYNTAFHLNIIVK